MRSRTARSRRRVSGGVTATRQDGALETDGRGGVFVAPESGCAAARCLGGDLRGLSGCRLAEKGICGFKFPRIEHLFFIFTIAQNICSMQAPIINFVVLPVGGHSYKGAREPEVTNCHRQIFQRLARGGLRSLGCRSLLIKGVGERDAISGFQRLARGCLRSHGFRSLLTMARGNGDRRYPF